jgi:hypothetical protein
MSDDKPSFWTNLAGILGALAALITAIAVVLRHIHIR